MRGRREAPEPPAWWCRRYLGKDAVNRRLISRLRRILSDAERRRLVRATRFGVDWIYETARKIAGEPK